MILAGDIGGTKAELGLFDVGGDARHPRAESKLATRDHPSLEAVVRTFLDGAPGTPERAVFGVAGPVRDNRCEATNLPWHMDGDALGRALGVRVTLLNDLAATAWGVKTLAAADLDVLQRGTPAAGARVLIAAGTGLGESIMAPDEQGGFPLASEGGHADFAPRTALEDELLGWLRVRYGRVSYERILSGPGIADLYRFHAEIGRGDEPAGFAQRFASAPDPAVVVTEGAMNGCERARLAIELFVDVYGAEAGNLALKGLALAGVYIGGGIAPRLRRFLDDGRFLRAFTDKGRMTPVLAEMPVAMILDPRTALWGAASYAFQHP